MTSHNGTPDEILDRTPPHDLPAELGLNGAAILKPDLLPAMIDAGYRAGLFYDRANQQLCSTILAVYSTCGTIDKNLLRSALEPHAEAIDGNPMALLLKTIDGCPVAVNWPHYLDLVREAWAKRQTFLIAQRMLTGSMNGAAAADIASDARQALEEIDRQNERLEPMGIGAMMDAYPHLAEPIVDGIFRRGETCNIVAPSKVGKSWLSYQLALSIVMGRYWLEKIPCRSGRVLLVDNELPKPQIPHRVKTTAEALGLRRSEYADDRQFDVLSLRGRLMDLFGICELLERMETGRFDVVILDAWYRALPQGVSENENGAIASLYNRIDRTAEKLNIAWVNIHHSSKGDQADKRVSDVGAGAGSQSRAADAHVILREHEERGAVVLEAVVRSFAPIEPLALRWTFPLWQPDCNIDPKALKGRLSRGEQKENEKEESGAVIVIEQLGKGKPMTVNELCPHARCGKVVMNRILARLETNGRVARRSTKRGHNDCPEFFLVKSTIDGGGLEGGLVVQTASPGEGVEGGGGGLLSRPQPASQPPLQKDRPPKKRNSKKATGKKPKKKAKLRVVSDAEDDDESSDEG